MEREVNEKIKIHFDIGVSNDRSIILHISTQIETIVAELLKISFGDQDSSSISFGDSSQALSFNSRINLLIDYNIYDKDERKVFQNLVEIRNKFAHNFKIHNLLDFLTNEGNEKLKFLEKRYRGKIKNYERTHEKVWELFFCLTKEIEESLNKFYMHLIKKSADYGMNELQGNFYKLFHELIDEEDFKDKLPEGHYGSILNFYTELNIRLKKTIPDMDEATKRLKGINLF